MESLNYQGNGSGHGVRSCEHDLADSVRRKPCAPCEAKTVGQRVAFEHVAGTRTGTVQYYQLVSFAACIRDTWAISEMPNKRRRSSP
jgi:hypothetical protein